MSGEERVTDRLERQLAALAHQPVRWEERNGLRDRIEGDPVLAEELAVQRRALELVAGAGRVLASSELNQRVAVLVDRSRRKRTIALRAIFAATPVAACVVAATVAIMLLPSAEAGFTLGEALALTKAPIMYPAPLQSVEQGAASRSGWLPVGTNENHIAGRLVTTVFYRSSAGRRVGYAIVGGRPLQIRGGTVARFHGLVYRQLSTAGRNVTTWIQGGHTHVLSGNVRPATLLEFAALKIE